MAAICMLNALWFKPDGGAQRYGEYGEAVMPILRDVGAELLFPPLSVEQPLEGDFDPDLIVLVRYPSSDAFDAMWRTEAYGKVGHLRTEAIGKAVLTRCAIDPEDAAPVTELPPGSLIFEALTFADGGAATYEEYLRQTEPLVQSRGGGLLAPRLIPQQSLGEGFMPDLVLLGHYPSMQTLYDVAATPEYQEHAPLRRRALKHAVTALCQPR
jgi:uncharacterized protein (DUF1330 family)